MQVSSMMLCNMDRFQENPVFPGYWGSYSHGYMVETRPFLLPWPGYEHIYMHAGRPGHTSNPSHTFFYYKLLFPMISWPEHSTFEKKYS